MEKKICVYCSASPNLNAAYVDIARTLGRALAERGDTLVYGGGSSGLMGEVANAVHDAGGRVIGFIPKMLVVLEFAYKHADELVITEDMRERKAGMESRADAFIVLPGGVGTLEEAFEIMTLRALNQTIKPLVFLNVDGFFEPLVAMLEEMRGRGFVRRPVSELFDLANTVEDALRRADSS